MNCFGYGIIALAVFAAGLAIAYWRSPRPVERFPIKTAPRNGQLIKLWFSGDDEPTVGWYLVKVGIDAPPPGTMILPADFSNWPYRWAIIDQLGNPLRRDLNVAVDGQGGPAWWAPL